MWLPFPRAGSLWLIAPLLLLTGKASAQLNSWTKGTSGNWEESAAWSLGQLPDSSQSVLITNPGWKAVAINPSTAQNFPASLTVANLTVHNGAGETTLLLNYFNDETPLHVLDTLAVDGGGRIVNYHSGLTIGGTFNLANTVCTQDGGTVQMTNGAMRLRNAEYNITNGTLLAREVLLAAGNNGRFKQHGGNVAIRDLYFGSDGTFGSYQLTGGTLNLSDIWIGVPYGGAQFLQSGGTNRVRLLNIGPALYGWAGSYTLSGGLLSVSNTTVFSAPTDGASGRFEQSGGTHVVTNTLTLSGALNSPSSYNVARYVLSNGTLTARFLNVIGYGSFQQHNGITTIAETIHFDGDWYRDSSRLSGGTLTCANVTTGPVGSDFFQSGGTFIVSNLLSFGGAPPWTSAGGYADFVFSGGFLNASNMEFSAELVISNSVQAYRITNAGFFKLSGKLHIGNATEQLGRFILASNATLNLFGTSGQLSFLASSAEAWTNGTTLVVTNWNGSTNGNGTERLSFGNNANGLSPTQLSQVRFANPPGYPPGQYAARILNTGEVVPEAPPAVLAAMRQGNELLLSWPAGWILESASHLAGTYSEVSGATSPHSVDVRSEPERYFRLRREPAALVGVEKSAALSSTR